MIAASLARAPLEQELRWLDGLVGNPAAYARLWISRAHVAGIDVTTKRPGNIFASWPIDDRHAERGEHLKILTIHMDDAGMRPAVIKLLEDKRCPTS